MVLGALTKRLTVALFFVGICVCRGQDSSAAPNTTPAAQVLGITTGIQQPPTIEYGNEMNAVNSLTGTKHGIVLYYVDWSTTFGPFLQDQLKKQMPATDVPTTMIAWEPTNGKKSLGCDQDYNPPNYPSYGIPPDRIIQSYCDTYIRNYANALKSDGRRYLLKFAHEMNSSGRPWWPGNYGEGPSTYVAMWRHVHDIFMQQGATNVEWVWGPIYQSAPNTPSNDMHLFYPGDNYVDWVGPMGYNYYNKYSPPQPWNSFATMFDSTLKDFACQYPKPQIVQEFATVEGDGQTYSKARWIAEAYSQAQSYPFLRALVWYNDSDNINPNADFRITTSTSGNPPYRSVQPLPLGSGTWTTAYKNAVASPVYTHGLQSLSVATPPGPYCGDGSTSLTVQNFVLARPGDQVRLAFQGWNYLNSLDFSLSLPAGITGSVSPTSLPAPWGKATVTLNIDSSIALGTYDVSLRTRTNGDLPIQVNVFSTIYSVNIPAVFK